MPRQKRSTIEEIQEERAPIQETVAELADSIEDDERRLLAKLKAKYANEEIGERLPGKRVRGEKTPWTYADMERKFEIVSFIPEETIPLNFNGVKVQAYAGIEMHVPKPFYDLYRRHRSQQMDHKAPPGIEVHLGAGALT